jgi:hypothetical protein
MAHLVEIPLGGRARAKHAKRMMSGSENFLTPRLMNTKNGRTGMERYRKSSKALREVGYVNSGLPKAAPER